MQDYDSPEHLTPKDHVRKALKVLRDGQLSFVDLVCTVLDPTERDFESCRKALYSPPTNGDSSVGLYRILDYVLNDARGAQLLRQRMESQARAIEISSNCNNVCRRESDLVKEGLRGPSSKVTVAPEFPRTSELDSSSVSASTTMLRGPSTSETTHPLASRAPQRTPTATTTLRKPYGVEFYFPHPDAGQDDFPSEGSPEWYIRKFLDGTITAKQVSSIWISLRGHDTSWLDKFIDCRGTAVLAQSLARISCKSRRNQADILLEQEIAKCLKVIFNSTSRVREAVKIPDIVTQITSTLNSPHLPTRRTIIEVLLSIVYCNRDSLDLVFHGLVTLSEANGDSTGCYDYWFQSLERVLRGGGGMGSLVGAGGSGGALVDYALLNICLIVHLMDVMDDLDVRLHHRIAMDSAGLPRIVELCRELGISAMNKQLDELVTMLEEDEQRLRERQENAILASSSNTESV